MHQAFRLKKPLQLTTSVVFGSPHSGRIYPQAFLNNAILNAQEIRSSEDAHVDRLFAEMPDLGAYLLAATLPRAYVDLNRAESELDPALIDGARAHPLNPRIGAGLGVIPRVVSEGRAIQRGKISMADAQRRLAMYYRPYHTQLELLLRELTSKFDEALLIDCHSMPSESLNQMGYSRTARPQIVLGDRFGASCSEAWTDCVETALVRAGFDVARNVPFAGAHIVQHYGRPSIGQHAIQIEIDRSIYMNEKTLERLPEFAEVKLRLTTAMAEICEKGRKVQRLAAE